MKLGKAILSIALIMWVFCFAIFGMDWFSEPTDAFQARCASLFYTLISVGFVIYLFPLFRLYERSLAKDRRHRQMEKMFGRNGGSAIPGFTEIKLGDESDQGLKAFFDKAMRERAMSGECDCDNCKRVRAEIEAEKQDEKPESKKA